MAGDGRAPMAGEGVKQPASSSPAPSGDPRVPVVAAAIDERWAAWVGIGASGRPAPPSVEVEAEAILEALDSWARDEIANTGASSAGLMIVALLSKLSVTQMALYGAVQAFKAPGSAVIVDGQGAVVVSAGVDMATVDRWERVARGDTPPVSDGLSG